MKPFMDKNFLLSNETAQKLYFDYAATTPVLDYPFIAIRAGRNCTLAVQLR